MSIKTTNYTDIEKFRKNRKEYNKKYYQRTAIYEPKKWTKEDDEAILRSNDITDTELSDLLQRSVQAIQVRRSRLLNKKKTN